MNQHSSTATKPCLKYLSLPSVQQRQRRWGRRPTWRQRPPWWGCAPGIPTQTRPCPWGGCHGSRAPPAPSRSPSSWECSRRRAACQGCSPAATGPSCSDGWPADDFSRKEEADLSPWTDLSSPAAGCAGKVLSDYHLFVFKLLVWEKKGNVIRHGPRFLVKVEANFQRSMFSDLCNQDYFLFSGANFWD